MKKSLAPFVAIGILGVLVSGCGPSGDSGQGGGTQRVNNQGAQNLTTTIGGYQGKGEIKARGCQSGSTNDCSAFSQYFHNFMNYLQKAPPAPDGFQLQDLSPKGFAGTYCENRNFNAQWKYIACKNFESRAVKYNLNEFLKDLKEVK